MDDDELFTDAPCGYVVTNRAGVVVRANEEFLRLVGRSHDDVVDRLTLSDLTTEGGRIFVQTHLLPMLQHDGHVREVALDLRRADGARVPVLINANLVSGGRGSGGMRAVLLETRDRQRYEENLRAATRAAELARDETAALAQTLQQTLIPPAPPRIPHLEIAAAYRSAGNGSEVGGDFYDVFQVGMSSWCVVLGDVSGKGIPAATVTSLVRYTVRSLAIAHPDPADLLTQLDLVMRDHPTDRYCTVALVRLDRNADRWTVRMSLAGHPLPLLVGSDRTVSELGTPGSPIGLVDEPEFHTVTRELTQEMLVLYTDGVTEARGTDGFFGDQRLKELLVTLPGATAETIDGITRCVIDYQRGVASDDIALVALAPARG